MSRLAFQRVRLYMTVLADLPPRLAPAVIPNIGDRVIICTQRFDVEQNKKTMVAITRGQIVKRQDADYFIKSDWEDDLKRKLGVHDSLVKIPLGTLTFWRQVKGLNVWMYVIVCNR